jgi:hypothetical protein
MWATQKERSPSQQNKNTHIHTHTHTEVKEGFIPQAFPEAKLIILKIFLNNSLFLEWEITTSVSGPLLLPAPPLTFKDQFQCLLSQSKFLYFIYWEG